MKVFILDSEEEYLDESGDRFKIADLDEDEREEYEEAEKIPVKENVDFCRRSGDVELSTSYIVIFEDGSIFDEDDGVFTPVRIMPED